MFNFMYKMIKYHYKIHETSINKKMLLITKIKNLTSDL